MLESQYQAKLIKRLRKILPGCFILKNDPEYLQGVPDIAIFYQDKWAMLEVKKSEKDRNAPEPNQEWYVDKLNSMSYASFIYPENEEKVLGELQQALST